MLACGHDGTPFGVPLCGHVRACREPWLSYVKWYTGVGLNTEFVCVPCAEEREKGLSVETECVCEKCYEYATTEVCDLVRAGGRPEIRLASVPVKTALNETAIPKELGKIVEIAPVYQENASAWLMLSEGSFLFRFDASNQEWARLGTVTLPSEVEGQPFNGHVLSRRLYASGHCEFAAVVSDYGRHGRVIDLRSGDVTLALDGGDYCEEAVPFSFAFADWEGRVIAIHRTAWNRLDISDAATGKLLTERGPTSYLRGEERPHHYLDYFHGGLYLSPKSGRILDDGWVWHPVGIPVTWSLERWLSENVWESEDGTTRKDVCARDGYWDHGVAWIDEERVAIAGIGKDDIEMVDGARIIDITATGKGPWRSNWMCAREVSSFGGRRANFSAMESGFTLRTKTAFPGGILRAELEVDT